MTDKRISQLTNITGSNVDDANDELAIVDASSNETKAITRGELMSSVSTMSITNDFTVDTDTLYVDSANDRVGIGTSSPNANLEINSGAFNAPLALTSTDDSCFISLKDDSTSLGHSDVTVGVGAKGDDMLIRAGASEAMRIDSSGNVGIGTSSPQGALHVGPGEFHTEARRVEARAISVSDTSSYTNVLTIGNRATYHILIGGSDASSGSNGLAIIEAYAVCSNDVEVEIAPNTIHNSSTRGIDVQWSGSTLQVKPRHSASNMWGVRVEVLGHYTASSISDITWHL